MRAMWNILGLQLGILFVLAIVAAGLGAIIAASTAPR
jgi:threonine/homoserine/homoserine lactone efflux protein